MITDPYVLRCEVERIIGEDRVPTEELARLLTDYGDDAQAAGGSCNQMNLGVSHCGSRWATENDERRTDA